MEATSLPCTNKAAHISPLDPQPKHEFGVLVWSGFGNWMSSGLVCNDLEWRGMQISLYMIWS